jgi:hypothetical protein
MGIRREVTIIDPIQEVGFDSKQLAGNTYTELCKYLPFIPHGSNEDIDAVFTGPEADPETGEIFYNVNLVVRRKYPKIILDKLG